MKLISWNVNGLRAVMKKNFFAFLEEEQPDVLCLQETKMQEGQAEVPTPGYHQRNSLNRISKEEKFF